jgi:CRISPR type IV-associated protein Csf3
MEALKITAWLMNGFCANDPYSPAIDGIIGAAFRREQLGDEQFALDVAHFGRLQPVEGLPLQVEQFGEDWWYRCSLPIYQSRCVTNRFIHRRFNESEAERHAGDAKKVEVTKGPYKNARLLLKQQVTDRIEWHVVGDRAEIDRLLQSISHVGKRIGGGFGQVRRWEIGEGDAETARFFRPLPREFADRHGKTGDIMQWGIRPPAKNNQRVCVMPYAGQ